MYIQADLVVIGGGASGFFCAVNAAELCPDKHIYLLETKHTFLSKVKVSGGGRCNITNSLRPIDEFLKQYPRGNKELKQVFHRFSPDDTIQWFNEHGVEVKAESDGRIFPSSNSSETVIQCFLSLAKKYRINLLNSVRVSEIIDSEECYIIHTNRQTFKSKQVYIATGGSNEIPSYLAHFNLSYIKGIPSLFSFHCNSKILENLSGISIYNVSVKVENSKKIYKGSLLITHQGISGPVILKTSAYEAKKLNDYQYNFKIYIQWTDCDLMQFRNVNVKRHVVSSPPGEIPKRLWQRLLEINKINTDLRWGDMSQLQMNQIQNTLSECEFNISGKSTHKEEFVTAGGIDLKEIDFKTMQLKKNPGIYVGGELLNIDGVTGGFNFQAAWSTGYVAAKSVAENM